MNVVSKLYDMASLSEASYVLFDKLNDDYSDTKIFRALLEKNNKQFEGRFSEKQAEEFVEHWKVIDHQANTSSGFSATLFRNKDNPNEYVYACRGTEGPVSLDLWSADAGDIVADGLALKQIVDMYNDCQRMLAPKGQAYMAMDLDVLVVETAALLAELALDLSIPGPVELALRARNDIIIDGPGLLSTVCTITPESSATLFSDQRAAGSGTLTASGLPTTATGHSLGGHLAMAYTRLFPTVDAQAYTINGAGFADAALTGNGTSNIRNLFSLLGGASAFDSTDILNLFASEGPEMVTMDCFMGLKQPGAHQEVITENWNPSNVFGHGAVQMTNALAVYDLFIKADSGLQAANAETVMAVLNPIFEAASSDTDATFETLLNTLGHLFVEAYAPIAGTDAPREDFYARVQQIADKLGGALQVESLVGKTSGELTTLAQTNIAARYALAHLIPFIITGNDALYAQHNANGQLGLYDAQTGQGMTNVYLDVRAKFLALKNELAVNDAVSGPVNLVELRGHYEDRATGLVIDNTEYSTRETAPEFIFGSDGAESMESFRSTNLPASLNDHMFGGGGNDIIRTHEGDDYLEGGSGDDTLDGGKGGESTGSSLALNLLCDTQEANGKHRVHLKLARPTRLMKSRSMSGHHAGFKKSMAVSFPYPFYTSIDVLHLM